MSQSRCARTFRFPVGLKKKKKHVRVQNAIRSFCAAAAPVTAISLFCVYMPRRMKRTREPPPPPVEHVALIRFVNHIHLEWEGEEVAAAASSEEHKGGKLIGRSVWGKALNIMLIAHPPQFAFCANYRKAKCEISFLSPPRRKVQYLLVPQGI